MTSLRKRLDYVLNQLSQMDSELDEEAAGNIVAQLSIIQVAFKESEQYPICCFHYDVESRVVCDSNGPMALADFMIKCRGCQAQIKDALAQLRYA